MISDAVLEMRGIGKRYRAEWVLSGVDLTIRSGESVALTGPNGSGKSTLLKIAATLLPHSTGFLQVMGRDPRRDSKAIRQKVRLLAHEKQLYGSLTVWENLKLAAQIRGETVSGLEAHLNRLGLVPYRDRLVRQLSEGLKKRVVLARLLVGQDPELVLLDEPQPTLDQEGREALREMIGHWKRSGTTILIASHEREQVLRLADRHLTLEAGRIAM